MIHSPRRSRERRGPLGRLLALIRANPLAGTIAVAGLLLGIYYLAGWLYVSEAERVERTLDSLRQAAVAGDPDAVMEHVSPYFATESLDHEQLAQAVHGRLQPGDVHSVSILKREVHVRGSQAAAELTLLSSHDGGRVHSRWSVQLEKVEDRWVVSSLELISLNRQEGIDLGWLLRHTRRPGG